MRFLAPIIAVSALSACAGESTFPLWDGEEPIEQYAKRTDLPATRKLDLGDGVMMEFVLIPAGTFLMGTREPERVDEEVFYAQMGFGIMALVLSLGVLLTLVVLAGFRAVRKKHRPQVSLAGLLVMVLVAGTSLLGGLHAWHSDRALGEARAEHEQSRMRYDGGYSDEKPAHWVALTKPYYIGRYEVTQEQYRRVMETNPSRFEGRCLPVEKVPSDDALEFCQKAGQLTQRTVRLPTEAEWEHACRAGTRTNYCSGDGRRDLGRVAWYEYNSDGRPHQVGQRAPNAWGVFDMHGNVAELCSDCGRKYSRESQRDPRGTDLHIRGGSYRSEFMGCRSACRHEFLNYGTTGLRVVLEP